MEHNKPHIWTKDFVGIAVINLLIFCGFQMLIPTLPIYMKSLSGADAVIGWITGLSTIAALLIRPFSGLATDKFGRKGTLLTGIAIIIAVTLAYMFFPVVGIILAIRFLHGIGWGMATTASNTVATDIIPRQRFGEGMGFFSLSTAISMALAPGIGLAVLAALQIRGLALVSAAFAATALILSLFLPYRKVTPKETEKQKMVLYERTAIRPSIIIFFVTATYGSIVGFISLYALDRGIEDIGAFFLIFAAAMLLARPLFGKLIDRFGFHAAMIPGLILLILSMFLLYRAASLPVFLVTAFSYGAGFGAVQSSLQTMSVVFAPRNRLGAANATFFTGFDGGIGFGSIIAGILASAWGYDRMYLAFTLFLILAGLLYLLIAGKIKKPGIHQ